MFRRLTPALVGAFFTFMPLTPSLPPDADALHATTTDIPVISATALASDSPPRAKLQTVQANALDSSLPIASSFEAAIGAASDAKLFIDHDMHERWPLTRGAMCQVIREVAQENRLPEPLFTRLI